ncbi:hypothetical protein ALC57_15650 [Trachymyrmex cornetzi]|uniref:Double jelly roll-like domain-containing protein n=1 Tax=Trachymyrmex cornetzi TaxID=471704 RepID=A0A151IWI6_9HYME|nr:hypothetical protein ALC57_15650 [Trachymyrmex cornetzi]
MTNILNIKDEPIFDDRIVKIETHTYNPFANITFGYSDEIRIPIQQQDLYTLPYESFPYVEEKLMKNIVVEGYKRVVMNARHELILIRARNNNNRFCKGYYGYEYLEPSLTFTIFLRNGPFGIIDCSRQKELVKNGIVNVRLDFECKENVPANTTPVPYSEAKRLITAAVFEHDAIVYVNGREKRTWLWNVLLDDERERMYIETLDAVYVDMESLTTLNVANTIRCGQYVKICALQNVFKIDKP